MQLRSSVRHTQHARVPSKDNDVEDEVYKSMDESSAPVSIALCALQSARVSQQELDVLERANEGLKRDVSRVERKELLEKEVALSLDAYQSPNCSSRDLVTIEKLSSGAMKGCTQTDYGYFVYSNIRKCHSTCRAACKAL